MRVVNEKCPHVIKMAIFTNADGPIFSKPLQMDSLTTKRNKTAPNPTQYGVK